MNKTIKNFKNLENKTREFAFLMAELGIKSANINIEEVKSFISANLKTCSEDGDFEYIYLFNEDVDKDNYELDNEVKCNYEEDLIQNESEKDEIKTLQDSKEPDEQSNEEKIESSFENIHTDNNSNSYEGVQNKDNEDVIEEKSVDEINDLNTENAVEEEIVGNSDINIEDEQCADVMNEDLDYKDEVCPGQVGFGFEDEEDDNFVPYEDDEYEDIDISNLQELEEIMAQNDCSEDECIYDEDSISKGYEEDLKAVKKVSEDNKGTEDNKVKTETQTNNFDDGEVICSVTQDNSGNYTVKNVTKENKVCPPNGNENYKNSGCYESEGDNSRKQHEKESCRETNKTCNENDGIKKKKGTVDFKEEDMFQKTYLKKLFKSI